jgi:predicted permease
MDRAYRLMLRLLPRPFRREFGDDMARLFDERRREAGRSWAGVGALWARAASDILAHSLAERWRPPISPIAPRKGATPMERWLIDVRYAVRGLGQLPGFTAAAVATLALGIGATVAIFTAVNGALLRPLPYAEPDRLVRVWPQQNFNESLAVRAGETIPALQQVSGMSGWLFTLTGEGDPQQISGVMVSWNHFELLGVPAALGRTFAAEEGLPGQGDVVVLSHGLWTSVFGADPGVIGRRIELAATDYPTRTVIGVMPADFVPLEPYYRLWSPLDIDPSLTVQEDDTWYVNDVLGRLRDGATTGQATEQLRGLAADLHEEWPARFEADEQLAATVEPLHEYQVRNLSGTLWTLFGAVGGVLLIACVNVANLLLARGGARRRELALRAALGATRARLVAQLLTEGLLLGGGGCLGGLMIAWAGMRLLARNAPEEYHQIAQADIDPAVMAFALVVSLAAVLLFGTLPAWRASAAAAGLAGSARGVTAGGGRLSQGLVVTEVALAVVLVAGAGLMLRSLWNLYEDDLGFDPRGLLTFRISIPEGRFEPEALPGHYRQIWDAIAAVPGVAQVGGIHLLPLRASNWSFPYVAQDHPVPEGTPRATANHRIVTPSYFATIGVPLLRGRVFSEHDTAGSQQVGMINERMANDLWPDEDPVGKQITVFGTPFTVIGVVADVHQHGLRYEPQPEMYRPFTQWTTGGMFALVRTTGDAAALAPSVKAAVWSVDFDAPVAQVFAMEEVFGETVAGDRFVSLLIAAFGALGLALGAVGVYGVTAYATGRRRREFGVRMAIGADREVVLRRALVDGLKPAVLGVALGVAGAAWAMRLLADLVYGVGTLDAATFATVPLVLIAVAVLACALPAWRASRLDPVTVLRQE